MEEELNFLFCFEEEAYKCVLPFAIGLSERFMN